MKREIKKWFACIAVVIVGVAGLFLYERSGQIDDFLLGSGAIADDGLGDETTLQIELPVMSAQDSVKGFFADIADKGEQTFNNAVNGVTPAYLSEQNSDENKEATGVMKIHFIDVGQGDAILVQQGDECMLIDAGNNDKGKLVCNYLDSVGVNSLTMLCVTHPDADHCGGVDDVLDVYGGTDILMAQCTNDTVTYDEMMDAVAATGSDVEYPSSGDLYCVGDARITVLCPQKNEIGVYADTNAYSIGLMVEYGDVSCIMCGDAPVDIEREIVLSGIDVDADVLKVGHHGSGTSTCDEFLNAVTPEYAVISVGEDSSYGHPHASVMEELQERDIELYRTDLQGTVVMTTDGTDIVWNQSVCADYSSGDN